MITYSDLENNAKAWAARQPLVTLKNPLIDNAGTTNAQAISKALTDYSNNVLGWSTNNNYVSASTNKVGTKNSNWFNNYLDKWNSDKYNLLTTGINAGTSLLGSLINRNLLSSTPGNILTGIGKVAGNLPGPLGWLGQGLGLIGLGVNAAFGHRFNDSNIASIQKDINDRNNYLFGDYSNTSSLISGSLANRQLGHVSKDFIGHDGWFSNKVANKTNDINTNIDLANLRANNNELLAYANYLNNLVRNAISNDAMGNVNMTANGGPLNMISGQMTPFGNRFFANGGYTHGGLFTNGFIEVNNGGSHELNPNLGVQYGVDPQGTPNMVEEGETILDDYVFSDRIKFPKKYKNEFSLGGKIWKKSFADVSRMIAKESEERPNDPISQRSLKAMGGKLADIQEEVKAKQALDKMDPREVIAMLEQLAALLQNQGLPLMLEQQTIENPYQLQMMQQQPIMAACGGKLHAYGGPVNKFAIGGNSINLPRFSNLFIPDYLTDEEISLGYNTFVNNNGGTDYNLFDYNNNVEARRRSTRSTTPPPKKEEEAKPQSKVTTHDITAYGFLKPVPESLLRDWDNTVYTDKRLVMLLLYKYLRNGVISEDYAMRIAYAVINDNYGLDPDSKIRPSDFLKNALSGKGSGLERTEVEKDKDGKPIKNKDGSFKTKKVTDEWTGNLLYNFIYDEDGNGYLGNNFTLNRGFDGTPELRHLDFNYNKDSTSEEDVLQYLLDYRNPNVAQTYLTKQQQKDEEIAREYYDAWGALPEDINYDDEKYKNIEATDPASEKFQTLNKDEQNIAAYKFYQNYFNSGNEFIDKLYYKFKKLDEADAEKAEREAEIQRRLSEVPVLYTGTRYAPLAFSSIATLLDSLGITNTPDLDPYHTLLALSSNIGKTPSVRYNPVFQPLLYKPINAEKEKLNINNLYAATNRNINNTALGNIGAATAGNIVALNSANDNLGKVLDVIANANIKNQQGVAEFNNRGAYQDSMASLDAQKVNTNNIQNALRFGYQALNDALKYYQAEQQASNAAKQVNLTHAVNSWANVGRENMYLNMINANKAFEYYMLNNGVSAHKSYT